MRLHRLAIATAAALAVLALVAPYGAFAQAEGPSEGAALSPYWVPAVSCWEQLIVRYAERSSLDPDLVAAVIWKESLGRPMAHSPAGAVGLMMLMPFPWRPSAEELENPWTNVAWGTRTLAQIVRDGHGDLYYALAAYNGSWEKVDQRNTRRYAAGVLDYYARAIAVKCGLPADGDWLAIFAVEGEPGPRTITVLGPQRQLARYSARPWQADVPNVPEGVPSTATAVKFVDDDGIEWRVSVWLVAADGTPLVFTTESGLPTSVQPELGDAAAYGGPQLSRLPH
jgi:Transglycosylase SLT domain